MTILQAFVLGIVQGLTEFLPISSSGHLVLMNHLLGIQIHDIAFEVAVHVGTLIAVIIYFRSDLLVILTDIFKGGDMRRVAWMLLLAMVPTGIIGLGLDRIITRLFQSPLYTAFGLLATSLILFVAEKVRGGSRLLINVRWVDAIYIGIMQGVAIIPGISRSGATISTGLIVGMNRDAAARFSFLLSIPAILAASMLHLRDFVSLETGQILPFVVGVVASMASGYIAIGTMMYVLRKGRLYGFSVYTLLLGLFSVFYFI